MIPEQITDAAASPDEAGSGKLVSIQPEYSTVSPFNCNNSKLLLVHQSYFGLYSVDPLRYLGPLPFEINASAEPRWSRNDPDALYFLQGNELRSFDLGAGDSLLVRKFTEYNRVSGKGEGDLPERGDLFVFCGDDRKIFTYQANKDQASNPLDIGVHSVEGLGLYATPDNHALISWGERGTGRFQGIELFDIDMNFVRQVANAGGHMDVTRWEDGREVLVWCNANAANPVCPNGIVLVDLQSDPAEHTCIVSLDWSLAMHISAPDNAGCVFVSTEKEFSNGAQWTTFENEILRVGLDGSTVSLGPHRSKITGDPIQKYNSQPKVACSRDGRLLVFGSNAGGDVMNTYLLRVDPPHMHHRPPRKVGGRVPHRRG
ncbi:MAG: hypothetical protein PHQ12_14480 [Chthoniobacteraceae bacterium]|nr:hypothetical protein [Chthoniobacteraceae bacterium]